MGKLNQSTEELARHECEPCRGDMEPLKGEALREYERDLGHNWRVVDDHHLVKEFSFDDYDQSVHFTNGVANIARDQDHHPDILLTYDKVKVTIFTHAIGGLSPNDFYLAAKIEEKTAA